MQAGYQMTLPLQTLETAPSAVRTQLEDSKARLGFVPNMYGAMANSPGLLDTYLGGYAAFRNDSGFTPPEQEAVFLVISEENGCEYCVSAHSMLADMKSKLDPVVIEAIRAGKQIADARLAELARFTRLMVRGRGLPSRADVEAFLAVGFQERHVLEVVLAIAVKTISNYSNHLFHTPLDEVFEAYRWTDSR